MMELILITTILIAITIILLTIKINYNITINAILSYIRNYYKQNNIILVLVSSKCVEITIELYKQV
jgi:hypothetical protein